MTPIELRALINSDPVALFSVRQKRDGDCAARCRELAVEAAGVTEEDVALAWQADRDGEPKQAHRKIIDPGSALKGNFQLRNRQKSVRLR